MKNKKIFSLSVQNSVMNFRGYIYIYIYLTFVVEI